MQSLEIASSDSSAGKMSSDSDGGENAEEQLAESLHRLTRNEDTPGEEQALSLDFAPNTYDGLMLALVLAADKKYSGAQGAPNAFMQFLFMLFLHLAAIGGQFMLCYWTFVSAMLFNLDPYVQVPKFIATIGEHLAHNVSLTNKTFAGTAEPNGETVLTNCRASTTFPLSHMVVLAVWGTRMLMELGDCCWRSYYLLSVRAAEKPGELIDWSHSTAQVIYLPAKLRIFLFCLLSVPQFMIVVLLGWTGSKIIALSMNMTGLVLKALTLQYIIGLDELVYTAFSSVRFKQTAGHAQLRVVNASSSNAWKMWGTNMIRFTALICYLCFVWWQFRHIRTFGRDCARYFKAFPQESLRHSPHWLFGAFPEWAIP